MVVVRVCAHYQGPITRAGRQRRTTDGRYDTHVITTTTRQPYSLETHARTALRRQEERLRVPQVVHLRVARPVRGVGRRDAHVARLVDRLLQLLAPAARDPPQVNAGVLLGRYHGA